MDVYGLVGKSLQHSFSKSYFSEKFQAEGIDAEYLNFEMEEVDSITRIFAERQNLKGLNVTVPYKESVIPFLDEVRGEAADIGAVNTIVPENGGWIGYNTDAQGFRDSIKPFLQHGMERALVLGTGGAAKAVSHVLERIGIEVWQVSRSARTGRIIAYGDLNSVMIKAFLLIVNTTPLGTWPDVAAQPELPYEGISSSHLLYDLVYNPSETAFMKQGRNRGATVINGLDMLRRQAALSWEMWQGRGLSR